MKIASLFTSKDTRAQKTICVLDIGSGSVGIAIVLLKEDAKPIIIQSLRKEIPTTKKKGFKGFMDALMATIEMVISEVDRDSLNAITSTTCFFSSPWFASETHTLEKHYESPTVVEKKNIEKLIAQKADSFFEHAKDTYKEFLSDSVELFEVENIQVKLNGYKTLHPFGQKATDIQIEMFLSVCSETIKKRLTKVLKEKAGIKKYTLHSFSLALFVMVRDMYIEDRNFTYIDVSGEMTDIGIVRDEIVKTTSMFPVGRNTFWDMFTDSFKTTRAEAISLYRMYLNKELTPAKQKKVHAVLEKVRTQWVKEFVSAIDRVEINNAIPNTVYLTADPDMGYWIADIIATESSFKNIFGEYSPKVVVLDSSLLAKYCEFGLDVRSDSFLILEAMYEQKVHNQ